MLTCQRLPPGGIAGTLMPTKLIAELPAKALLVFQTGPLLTVISAGEMVTARAGP
jgi:hypothetical protein